MKQRTILWGYVICAFISIFPILSGLAGIAITSILGCNWSLADKSKCLVLNIDPLIDLTKMGLMVGFYVFMPLLFTSVIAWTLVIFISLAIETSLLLRATRRNDIKSVKKFLNVRPQVDSKDRIGNTGLMIAAQNGHVNLVKLFLEYGADPEIENKKQENAMQLATKYGHAEIIALLTKVK